MEHPEICSFSHSCRPSIVAEPQAQSSARRLLDTSTTMYQVPKFETGVLLSTCPTTQELSQTRSIDRAHSG